MSHTVIEMQTMDAIISLAKEVRLLRLLLEERLPKPQERESKYGD